MPLFAYVANLASDDVSAYAIDSATGALTQVPCIAGCNGPNFLAGGDPSSVAIAPSGKFAYVANQSTDDVSAFAIDATTGVLTEVPCGAPLACTGTRFPAGDFPASIAVDPSGRFAYVANKGVPVGGVSAYAIDATTGVLTQIDADPAPGVQIFPAGLAPTFVAVDPLGKFAYVVNLFSNDVSAYAIDTVTGALTPISCLAPLACNGTRFLAGGNPSSVAIEPSGRFAYVANQSTDDVSAFAIDATTGVLSKVLCTAAPGCSSGSNFRAVDHPTSVAIDPSGRVAYVANQVSGDVSAYGINATSGELTSMGASVAAESLPSSVVVEPLGKFAYVTNSSTGLPGNSVSIYAIDAASGALVSVGSAPMSGIGPVFIAAFRPIP